MISLVINPTKNINCNAPTQPKQPIRHHHLSVARYRAYCVYILRSRTVRFAILSIPIVNTRKAYAHERNHKVVYCYCQRHLNRPLAEMRYTNNPIGFCVAQKWWSNSCQVFWPIVAKQHQRSRSTKPTTFVWNRKRWYQCQIRLKCKVHGTTLCAFDGITIMPAMKEYWPRYFQLTYKLFKCCNNSMHMCNVYGCVCMRSGQKLLFFWKSKAGSLGIMILVANFPWTNVAQMSEFHHISSCIAIFVPYYRLKNPIWRSPGGPNVRSEPKYSHSGNVQLLRTRLFLN